MIDFASHNSCDNIIEFLWLGSHISSKDEDFMVKNNIKLVVNCTIDLVIPSWYDKYNIRAIRLPIHDINNNETNNILNKNMDEIVDIIHEYRQNGQGVLVHCFAGISRSATTVASYLIRHYEYNYQLAKFYIQNKRSITFMPIANFGAFLKTYNKN